MCPLLHIGDLRLSAYWLMCVCGGAAGALYVALSCRGGKTGHLAWYHSWIICCLASVTAFAGAKLVMIPMNIPGILKNWSFYRCDHAALWSDLTAGHSFFGFLLLICMLSWYCRRNGLPLEDVRADLAPTIPLFMTFARIGCFLGGCCYGVPVSRGVVFPEGSYAPAGIPLFPNQLAEAAGQLLLFVALVLLSRRDGHRWLVYPLYLGGYGALRFILEFWRGDAVRVLRFLSMGQCISIVLMTAAAIIVWRHEHTNADVSS